MGASILCLDVAHGHHTMMKEAIMQIKSRHPYVHIMAGNIATKQAFEDLASWGADSVRIGIGGGFHLLHSYSDRTWHPNLPVCLRLCLIQRVKGC